jgi:hypothetical protein
VVHHHVSDIDEKSWAFCDPSQLRNTSDEAPDVNGHEDTVERNNVMEVHLNAQIWILRSKVKEQIKFIAIWIYLRIEAKDSVI